MDEANGFMGDVHHFYGRIKTRSISAKKQNIMDTVLGEFGIKSFDDICNCGSDVIDLEIGFGDGTHLAQMAIYHPDRLFIGAEPFINGVASLAQKIYDNNIKNIRIYNGNAHAFLPSIRGSAINTVYILFPDPWPKRKHNSRRFINDESLQSIHKILSNNGILRIATDHEDYCHWILKHLKKYNGTLFALDCMKERPPVDQWPVTKYEQKSVTPITYIICTKLPEQ